MPHAIRIHDFGGPEVMKWEEVEVGDPGPGQAKIKQYAAGVNYIDVYHRTGLYKQASLPFTPGSEGAGKVIAVGPGVMDIAVGDRVAYAGALGGYAEERLIAADRLVKIPDDITYETAAAMMLQGMTVRYLVKQTYHVTKDSVDALACRGRRRRADRMPMGVLDRRDDYRHGWLRGEGASREIEWLHACHQLPDRRLCGPDVRK